MDKSLPIHWQWTAVNNSVSKLSLSKEEIEFLKHSFVD